MPPRGKATRAHGDERRSSPDPGVFADARDAEVRDSDGRRLGTLEQVFVAAGDGHPLWVEIAGGLFGMAKNIAPAAGARRSGEAIVLAVAADLVAHAPTLDPSDGITAAEHAELEAHYGCRTRVEDTAT